VIELIILSSKLKEAQLIEKLSELATNISELATSMLTNTIVAYVLLPSEDEKGIDKEVMKALMLPLPIRSIKREGNKIIVELGEGEGEQK